MHRCLKVLFVSYLVWISGCQAHPISLWQIDHEDARVYLLGSIHAMKPELYPLPEPMMTAFDEAEVVVFEVDLKKITPVEMNQIMQARGFYPKGENVGMHLSKETLSMLESYIRGEGLEMRPFLPMRPWLINLQLGVMQLNKNGFESSMGVDTYLQNLAYQQSKKVVQLETFEEQIDVLASDSAGLQELSLRVSLEEMDDANETIESLINAWLQGDAEAMYRTSELPSHEYPELEAQMVKLLDERNTRMESHIRRFLDDDKVTLVVVGALHMGGPKGLLNLLGKDFKIIQHRVKTADSAE